MSCCDDNNVPAGLLSSPRNERLDKISDGALLGRLLVALHLIVRRRWLCTSPVKILPKRRLILIFHRSEFTVRASQVTIMLSFPAHSIS